MSLTKVRSSPAGEQRHRLSRKEPQVIARSSWTARGQGRHSLRAFNAKRASYAGSDGSVGQRGDGEEFAARSGREPSRRWSRFSRFDRSPTNGIVREGKQRGIAMPDAFDAFGEALPQNADHRAFDRQRVILRKSPACPQLLHEQRQGGQRSLRTKATANAFSNGSTNPDHTRFTHEISPPKPEPRKFRAKSRPARSKEYPEGSADEAAPEAARGKLGSFRSLPRGFGPAREFAWPSDDGRAT